MTFVDSHCHLNYAGLVEDQAAVVARARARGVNTMVNIATRESEWDAVLATAQRFDGVFATVGIHPHDADAHEHVDSAKLVARCSLPKVVGLGETGLDYYYDKSDRSRQRASFRSHLHAAVQTGLPLVVHTRDAEEDTIELLGEVASTGPVTGVIHCFSGSQWLADQALALGFYISLSGILTFRNAEGLRDVAATIPHDRLLIETDAPFLAPVPHRGKQCEPSFVVDTATVLAATLKIDIAELASITTENFARLFTKTQV